MVCGKEASGFESILCEISQENITCFDNGLVEKQQVASKEYCVKYRKETFFVLTMAMWESSKWLRKNIVLKYRKKTSFVLWESSKWLGKNIV